MRYYKLTARDGDRLVSEPDWEFCRLSDARVLADDLIEQLDADYVLVESVELGGYETVFQGATVYERKL